MHVLFLFSLMLSVLCLSLLVSSRHSHSSYSLTHFHSKLATIKPWGQEGEIWGCHPQIVKWKHFCSLMSRLFFLSKSHDCNIPPFPFFSSSPFFFIFVVCRRTPLLSLLWDFQTCRHTCLISSLLLPFVWMDANVKFRVARSRANHRCRALTPESPLAGAGNTFWPRSHPEITIMQAPTSKEWRHCVAVLRVLLLTAAEGNSDRQRLSAQQHHGNVPRLYVNCFIVFWIIQWPTLAGQTTAVFFYYCAFLYLHCFLRWKFSITSIGRWKADLQRPCCSRTAAAVNRMQNPSDAAS